MELHVDADGTDHVDCSETADMLATESLDEARFCDYPNATEAGRPRSGRLTIDRSTSG